MRWERMYSLKEVQISVCRADVLVKKIEILSM